MRSNRVSRPDYNHTWKFMDEHGLTGDDSDLEKGILEKHKRAVNAAIIATGLNSTGRPRKAPAGDAPTPGKDSNGKELCNNFKAGRCKNPSCRYSHGATPGGGGRPTGSGKGAPKGASGELGAAYTAIPNDVKARCFKAEPPICVVFAYYGRCGKSSGASCTSSRDKPLRHVCSQCEFATDPHPITNGSCPN